MRTILNAAGALWGAMGVGAADRSCFSGARTVERGPVWAQWELEQAVWGLAAEEMGVREAQGKSLGCDSGPR